MMAAKEEGEDPSYALALQRCPLASLNPQTDLPFTPKYLRKVFTEDCYDITPDNPWRFQRCLQKTWLPPEMRAERLAWARTELQNAKAAVWYFNDIIWFDPCSKIIPAGPKKAADQKQAERGVKRYLSDDAKEYSRNLQGPKYAKSQKSWGDSRYHWILVLSLVRIHVEVMPVDWLPDAGGMGVFVKMLPRIFRRVLGRKTRKPRVLYSDRGPGMFVPKTGQVTGPYTEAARKKGFRLYTGESAKGQPSDVADILLHETAISCFKKALHRTRPKTKPWKETRQMFAKRVAEVVKEANNECDFRLLSCEYLERLQLLKEKKGVRLRK